MTAARKPCAACGKPSTKKQGPGFMFAGKDVPLCDECWGDGENDEAWDARICQRIRDRRAGRKPRPPKTFSVLVTTKQTWSLRGVEAEDEGAAIAKVRALAESGDMERHGHEVDCDLDIDSVNEEPREPAPKRARGKG